MQFLKADEKYCLLTHYMDRHNEKNAELFFEKIKTFTSNDWKYLLGRSIRTKTLDYSNYQYLHTQVIKELHWKNSKRGIICSIEDHAYPELLKEIPDPPIVLYLKGDSSLLNQASVSIVGTRTPNSRGKHAAHALGGLFCQEGYHVVSGFARGIDIESHRGLIDAHKNAHTYATQLGKAIVVLGTSVDQIYPKEFMYFAQKILATGGVFVSEYSPYDSIGKYSFIARNRIISGLSMNTILVQAPEKSGALATARFGLEQGRSVWVHEVGNCKEFLGTKNLVDEGAELLSSILED